MNNRTRILLIDDESAVRALIKEALSEAGYVVLEAANGKEGLECYRNSRTDLVITDLIMPEKEGIETIMELCHDFPDVKIIAISGGSKFDSQSNLRMAQMLGAKNVLAKPFNIADLVEVVREVLDT